MTHPMVDQMIRMMGEIRDLDFDEAPGIKFMASLRKKLIGDTGNMGFTVLEAETIAASVNVMLPLGSVTDDHIETLAELYCDIICKAHAAIKAKGFAYPMVAVLQMAKNFSLKLE